jgi:hypothetical protein
VGEGQEGEYQHQGPLEKEVKALMAANSGRQAKFEAAEVVVKQVRWRSVCGATCR